MFILSKISTIFYFFLSYKIHFRSIEASLYTRYESYFLRNPLKKSPLFSPCIKTFGRFRFLAKPTYPKRRIWKSACLDKYTCRTARSAVLKYSSYFKMSDTLKNIRSQPLPQNKGGDKLHCQW